MRRATLTPTTPITSLTTTTPVRALLLLLPLMLGCCTSEQIFARPVFHDRLTNTYQNDAANFSWFGLLPALLLLCTVCIMVSGGFVQVFGRLVPKVPAVHRERVLLTGRKLRRYHPTAPMTPSSGFPVVVGLAIEAM